MKTAEQMFLDMGFSVTVRIDFIGYVKKVDSLYYYVLFDFEGILKIKVFFEKAFDETRYMWHIDKEILNAINKQVEELEGTIAHSVTTDKTDYLVHEIGFIADTTMEMRRNIEDIQSKVNKLIRKGE